MHKNYSGTDYELKYLFVAELYNGQIIKQDPTDKPKYSTWGSAFTDVVNEHVKRFSLVGAGHLFTVDLTDGHMEVDKRVVFPSTVPPKSANLQLIYYRQVQRSLRTGPEGVFLTPVVRYFIGWQYTNNIGKNCKWEMGVD